AGGAGNRTGSAFQFLNQVFERAASRVIVTAVGLTLFLQREYAVQLLPRIVGVARRRINRSGDRDEIAGPLAPVAAVDGFAFDFHDRFQRTPSLVSSSMTPWAASWLRIASERPKSRDLLAAVRSAM